MSSGLREWDKGRKKPLSKLFSKIKKKKKKGTTATLTLKCRVLPLDPSLTLVERNF